MDGFERGWLYKGYGGFREKDSRRKLIGVEFLYFNLYALTFLMCLGTDLALKCGTKIVLKQD